jgi:hypothetical protein
LEVCTISAAAIHLGLFLKSVEPGQTRNLLLRAPWYSLVSVLLPTLESRPVRRARWICS